MSNINLVKEFIRDGEKIQHLQILSFIVGNKKLDLTFENSKVKSAIIYSTDLKSQGWLSVKECEELTPYIQEYLQDYGDSVYY